jgi:hypothetical protein
MKSTYFAAVASASLVFMGCGSTDTQGQENLGESGATLLFVDHFADGGVMEVVEQDNGMLGFSVSAPIRSEVASKAMRASTGKRTLAEIYAALHDGSAAVPEVLKELSARLELERPTGTLRERPAAPALIEVEDKTKSDFVAAFCRDFADGFSWAFVLAQCKYNNLVNKVTTNPLMDGDNNLAIDRSLAWNDSSWSANLKLSASSWVPTIAANSNGYAEWGGVYSDATAQLIIPGGHNGPLGITVHDDVPRPP